MIFKSAIDNKPPKWDRLRLCKPLVPFQFTFFSLGITHSYHWDWIDNSKVLHATCGPKDCSPLWWLAEIWEPCHELAVLHQGVRISYTIMVSSILYLYDDLTYLVALIDDRQRSRRPSAEDRHHRRFKSLRDYFEVLHHMRGIVCWERSL